MNKRKTWEEEVMRILIEYDDRYSMASLEILMDKIRPVIKQEILRVLDEVEQVYKGKQMRINEASKYLRVSSKTLRRWETKGILIPFSRSQGGHRIYTLFQLQEFETRRKQGKKLVTMEKGKVYWI